MAQEAQQSLSELLIFPELPEALKTYPDFDFNGDLNSTKSSLTSKLRVVESRPDEPYNDWKNSTGAERTWYHDAIPANVKFIQSKVEKTDLGSSIECTRYINVLQLLGTQARILYDIMRIGRQASCDKRKSILNTGTGQGKAYAKLFSEIISNIKHYSDGHYNIWADAIKLEPAAAKKYKEGMQVAISRLDLTSNNWKDQLASMFSAAPFGDDDGAKTIRNAFIEEQEHGTVAGIKGTPTADLVTNITLVAKMRKRLTQEHEKLGPGLKKKIGPLLLLATKTDTGFKRSQDDVDSDLESGSAGPSGKRSKHST